MSTGTQIALGVGIALVIFVSVLALRRREPKPPRQEREISQEALAQAKELVADGWKIKAIKVIRDETGWPLKRCKDITDRMKTKPEQPDDSYWQLGQNP